MHINLASNEKNEVYLPSNINEIILEGNETVSFLIDLTNGYVVEIFVSFDFKKENRKVTFAVIRRVTDYPFQIIQEQKSLVRKEKVIHFLLGKHIARTATGEVMEYTLLTSTSNQ